MDALHWFIFTFMYSDNIRTTYCNSAIGFSKKTLTSADIYHAKEKANAPNDAITMNISYLGYMTKKEFKGK